MKFHININLILDIVITKKQKLEQYNIIKMFQHHNKAPRPTYTGTIAIRYTVGREPQKLLKTLNALYRLHINL